MPHSASDVRRLFRPQLSRGRISPCDIQSDWRVLQNALKAWNPTVLPAANSSVAEIRHAATPTRNTSATLCSKCV